MSEQNITPVLPIRSDAKSDVKATTIDSEDHSMQNAKHVDEKVPPTMPLLPALPGVLSPVLKSNADDTFGTNSIPSAAAHCSQNTAAAVIATEEKVLEENKGSPRRSPELAAAVEVQLPFDTSEKAPENEGDSKPLQTFWESKPADCAKNAIGAHALDRLTVEPESKPLRVESVHEAAQEELHESSFRCSQLASVTTPPLRNDKPEKSFETETVAKAGKLDSTRKYEEHVQERDQFERTSGTKQDCTAKRTPEKRVRGDLKKVEPLRLESKSEKFQSGVKSQKAVEDKDRLANNSDKQSNCPPQQLLMEDDLVDFKPLEVAGKANEKENLEGFKALSNHLNERQGDVPERACTKDEQMNAKDSQSPEKSPKNIHNEKTLKSSSTKLIPSSESECSSSESSESGSSTLESDSSSTSSAEVVIATTALMMKDDEGPTDKAALRTKNEQNVNDIEIKKPTIQVTAAHKLRALGKVSGVMDKTVIIMSTEAEKAKSSGMPCVESERDIAEASALDSGSIVCFDDRTVLGEIFETFGQVRSPYYIIRFNKEEEISEVNAKVGRDVFYVPELSKTVRARDVHVKGYDSSNFFDEEVGNKEFSDDEAEAEARRSRKRARQGGVPTSLSAKSIQRGAMTPKRFMPRQRLQNQNERQGWRTRPQSEYAPGHGGDGFNPTLGPTATHMGMSATGATASNGAFHRGQRNNGSWGAQRGNEFANRMVNAVNPPNAMRHGNARVSPNNAYANSMYTHSALTHQPGVPWVNGGQTYQGSPNSAMLPHGSYPGGGAPFPAPNSFLPYNQHQPPTQFQGTPNPSSTYSPQWAGHPSSSIQGQPLQYPTGPNSQMYSPAPIIYPPGAYNYPQSSFVPETPPPNFPASANDFPRPPHK